MTNREKFDEHNKLVSQYNKQGVIHSKPSVDEMEKLKYSDDPYLRKDKGMRQYVFIGDSGDNLFLLGLFRGDSPKSAYAEMEHYCPLGYVGEVRWYLIGNNNSWWEFEKK